MYALDQITDFGRCTGPEGAVHRPVGPRMVLVKSRSNSRSNRSLHSAFSPDRAQISALPILSRTTESAAERVPSARCNALKRRCAGPQHLHVLALHLHCAKLFGNASIWLFKTLR